MAGQMPRQKLGDKPTVDVIAAARAVADEHAQRLAAIEIRDRIGADRHRRDNRCRSDRGRYDCRVAAES
jgi:hypothetical protein